MGAPKGNEFWKARSSHGCKPIFNSPEELFDACCEYFQWVEDNPLKEGIVYQGKVSEDSKDLMRAMTESGLCIFLDICWSTWDNYKKKDDFLEVTTRVVHIIYNQKFTGAAADLLNANLIARELGLADKKELSGVDGKPIETIDVQVTDEDAVRSYMDMIKKPQ